MYDIVFMPRKFLSTLSLRRATTWQRGSRVTYVISIHALLAESDLCTPRSGGPWPAFLSTLSLRRATQRQIEFERYSDISIHALLAESDALVWCSCGGAYEFLSTLSLRRATAKVHKTVGHFCAYETNFMEIASSC